jgi:hypothetical protein
MSTPNGRIATRRERMGKDMMKSSEWMVEILTLLQNSGFHMLEWLLIC